MLDWPAVGAFSAFTAVIGGGCGWLIRHAYDRGGKDAVAGTTDIQHAASIIRIEATMDKLASNIAEHERVDEGRFSKLETLTTANGDAMKSAAAEMRELTRQVAGLVAQVAGLIGGDQHRRY